MAASPADELVVQQYAGIAGDWLLQGRADFCKAYLRQRQPPETQLEDEYHLTAVIDWLKHSLSSSALPLPQVRTHTRTSDQNRPDDTS